MPKKTLTPEQIVARLRQIEVLVSQEKAVPLACKEAGIGEYYAARVPESGRAVTLPKPFPPSAPLPRLIRGT